ncbi:MAG TPA: DUF4397 domain-containing protein [Burkholderiaceae bacterium]|nr:DUF4397 domain-containing protein [Burkholderiaceae bacterium]
MKNFSWWSVVGLTAATVAVSGCGSGGGDSSSANVRVANATLSPSHASIDLLVNAAIVPPAVAVGTVSAYAAPAAGSVTLQVNDAGGATALVTAVPTLTGGNHYTVVAYESGGVVKFTPAIGEDVALPAAGVTTLRIYDAAIEAGAVDVYITAGACTTANLTTISPAANFGAIVSVAATTVTQGAGTYNVCATGSGSKTDIRMSLPVTLAGQTVATVLMTPTSGGALINGALLVQQGAYTAVPNPNARVRLAAAVSGGATVTALASDSTLSAPITIDSSVAPAFGFYALVPATSSLNVNVGVGNSVQVPGSLVAGSDATLLVYGSPSSSTATLIADDNRPPTSATATRLRLINGVTGSAGTLTLTANSAPVGINIGAGQWSSYQSLIGTTNNAGTANTFSFGLTSSTAGPLTGLLGASGTGTLNSNATYSVLAVGDISAPQLLTR